MSFPFGEEGVAALISSGVIKAARQARYHSRRMKRIESPSVKE
jgi:hypothetical protein